MASPQGVSSSPRSSASPRSTPHQSSASRLQRTPFSGKSYRSKQAAPPPEVIVESSSPLDHLDADSRLHDTSSHLSPLDGDEYEYDDRIDDSQHDFSDLTAPSHFSFAAARERMESGFAQAELVLARTFDEAEAELSAIRLQAASGGACESSFATARSRHLDQAVLR